MTTERQLCLHLYRKWKLRGILYVTGTTRYIQFPIDYDLPLNAPIKQIEKVNMIDFVNAFIAD